MSNLALDLCRTILATTGGLLDIAAALVLTIPIIREPSEDRERRAVAAANAEVKVAVWGGAETDQEVAQALGRYSVLFEMDRRRALWSVSLALVGILCSFGALWLPYL